MSTEPVEPLLDMDQVKVDPAWALRVPASLAVRRQLLPFALVQGQVCVACSNQRDASAIQALQRQLQQPLKLYNAEPASLKRALDRIYGNAEAAARMGAAAAGKPRTGDVESEDAVSLCDELLSAALVRQASDVHLNPKADKLQVRFRVDGVLEDYRPLPIALHASMVSRFKVLSGMDISERRSPQDGRFTHTFGGQNQKVDVRVATLPTRHGERMTLRLLAVQTESLTLEKLGMSDADLKNFSHAIDRPHGLILITGPTGSGKTTSLYAAIRKLIAGATYNVITIEDPIEYEISDVQQVEVDSADKVSFAKALRSVLRHDPDVVMIGEIRDHETADIAIKSSLTGHLVMSTLHTNSAVSAVTRLVDMEIDRFLIAATLRLAVAQRLVRRLCQHCHRSRPLTHAEAETLSRPAAGTAVFDPVGCMYCANRGYVGRLGVFEMLPVDERIAGMISSGAEETALIAQLRLQQQPQLVDDGLMKMQSGLTSAAEVLASVASW
ncbi:GspE/PulE family protein [Anatilimnocola floriformis]|uniref:GspE/PulE family protein n=1 Tax=Anatilimnocola floriformis TaxID=2948575 RepID=UPI0020C42C3C|nr:GspE/PulE family protein [Anatilimnocola floriformis]